jgi:hypothetical protein
MSFSRKNGGNNYKLSTFNCKNFRRSLNKPDFFSPAFFVPGAQFANAVAASSTLQRINPTMESF